MKHYTERESERIVHESWRICTNSRHPHVWNVATTATALFKQPKRILLREFCPSHGGLRDEGNKAYVDRWVVNKNRSVKEQNQMNNRDKIRHFFVTRHNEPATFEEMLRGLDLVCSGRKPARVLEECVKRLKKDGSILWSRSGPGKRSRHSWNPRQLDLKQAEPVVETGFYFVADGKGKINNELVGVHEQKTLEHALVDWTARKGAGGTPRLFRVVELHPTLTAKL